MCDVLLENMADVNAVGGGGKTPLYRAVSRELLDVVRKMLEVYGGNPNVGSPMLALAFEMRNMELVHLLLKHGADPNKATESFEPSKHHRLPLHMAGGNSELVELLLKHGANAEVRDIDGNTALHHAVERGQLKVCEIFLENNCRRDDGQQ